MSRSTRGYREWPTNFRTLYVKVTVTGQLYDSSKPKTVQYQTLDLGGVYRLRLVTAATRHLILQILNFVNNLHSLWVAQLVS